MYIWKGNTLVSILKPIVTNTTIFINFFFIRMENRAIKTRPSICFYIFKKRIQKQPVIIDFIPNFYCCFFGDFIKQKIKEYLLHVLKRYRFSIQKIHYWL